jgi:hypothetical protein
MIYLAIIMQLLCMCLLCTGAISAAQVVWTLPKDDSHIDFSNISTSLRGLFSKEIDPRCKMPQSSIIVTYSNKYHMDLLALQHQSTSVLGGIDEACLSMRFVTVCLDRDCFAMCHSLQLYNCVLVSTTNLVYPPSSFLEGAFFYLSFLKYLILQEIFKEASEVFFIDADVLLYCNPWMHHIFDNKNRDFLYSLESVSQRRRINGGQYFLRNTVKVKEWLSMMIQARELVCKPRTQRDKVSTRQRFISGLTSSSSSNRRSSFRSVTRRANIIIPPRHEATNRRIKPLLLDQDYAGIFAEKVGLNYTWTPTHQLGSHNHRRNVVLFPPTACTNHVCGTTGTY